ncbi:MAG: hypothetical protein HYY76_02950 [Acidobacteria bacterium]|nr:hypothetical protein [Acidobacteriota bacterium]
MSRRSFCTTPALAALFALAWVAEAGAQGWTGPRTPDGQPDIQGIWEAGPGANNAGHSLEEGCCDAEHNRMQNRRADNIGLRQQIIVDPPNGRIPFQPWAAARRQEHLINLDAPTELQHIEPEDRCSLQGVPRSNLRGPMQVLQTAGQVVILYEWVHAYRVIPIDGRPFAPQGTPLWQGDARGRWEGRTLVVETRNFRHDPVEHNKQPWIDSHGTFYSDALRVVERWAVVDANTIDYEATIEDPKVFTQPWKIAYQIERVRQRNYEFLEEACWEGVSVRNRLDAGRLARKAGKIRPHSHSEQ